MAAIIALPLRHLPLVDRRTPPGGEIVVAPHGEGWAAWVRLPSGRVLALECTSDRAHVLADAEAYAARVGCPLTIRDTPAGAEPERPATRGLIYIWPNPEGGGSWGIEHESENGDSSALLATAFSLDEAVTLARAAAAALGAAFDDPRSPIGGAA